MTHLAPVSSRVVKMSFNEIKNILIRRNNASTQHERDYSDICIEWMRTLPMEAAAGALFLTPEGETMYLNSICILLELASDFEKNKSTIGHICAEIDRIPLTAPPAHHGFTDVNQILREAERSRSPTSVSHIMTIYREMKNTILAILAILDPAHRKMMVNLFDKYILSLAVVGQEKALSVHNPLTNLGRRIKPAGTDYIIQSIGDPDFSMRDFLLKGPVSMFYGYEEPARFEIVHLCYAILSMASFQTIPTDDSHYRDYWIRRRWQVNGECTAVVRNIQGLKKERTAAARQFKKLYPNEYLNLARVLTRLT